MKKRKGRNILWPFVANHDNCI